MKTDAWAETDEIDELVTHQMMSVTPGVYNRRPMFQVLRPHGSACPRACLTCNPQNDPFVELITELLT